MTDKRNNYGDMAAVAREGQPLKENQSSTDDLADEQDHPTDMKGSIDDAAHDNMKDTDLPGSRV